MSLSPESPGRASLLDAWYRFWFTPIPPHSYALLRILFGAMGCISLIGLRDLDTFWALDGMVPDDDYGLGLKALLRSTGFEQIGPSVLYFSTLGSLAAMMVGYRTSATVTLSLLLCLVHVTWNALPLSGAHAVMTSVLFCLIWADCGSVWSVDAWLERRRQTDPIARPREYPIAPLRLIRFQIALIYLSTGLWKLYNPLWRDGSALHFVLNNNVFHRFPFALAPEWEWLLTFGTYSTLIWEIGFAFGLLFTRTRRLVLIAGVLIHLGMFVALEIGPFSLVMLSSYVAFLDPRRVALLPSRLTRLRMPGRPTHRYNEPAAPQVSPGTTVHP